MRCRHGARVSGRHAGANGFGGAMARISSAIARALARGAAMRQTRSCCTRSSSTPDRRCVRRLALVFGPAFTARSWTRRLARAALRYSNVVFAGSLLIWLVNALASVLRGTGNMLVPAVVVCGGIVLLVPLSPCLIFASARFRRWASLAARCTPRVLRAGARHSRGTCSPDAVSCACILLRCAGRVLVDPQSWCGRLTRFAADELTIALTTDSSAA